MALPPPAVNSAIFAHHAPNADPAAGDAVSAAIVAAGKAFEAAYKAMDDGHAAHMANPMLTPAANLKRSADHSDRVMHTLGAALAPYAFAIEDELAKLDAKVNAPLALPKEPGNHYSVTAQQIREHFANLPEEERLKRAMRAATDNDVVTLGALLNAPGYLSGMDYVGSKTGADQQKLLAHAYRQKHFARELERLAKLQKCRAMMDTAINFLLVRNTQLHPAEKLAHAAKLDKSARDAVALAEKFL